jgi:PhoPQ-activated pathogenicity-related protein
MIADGQELPVVRWQFKDKGHGEAELAFRVSHPAKGFRLWTADSSDRDFRDEKWSSRELEIKSGSSQASAEVAMPREGYRAYFIEALLSSSTGQTYKLSTEARVIPNDI